MFYLNIYIYIYIHIHIYMYIYIYSFIHSFISTQPYRLGQQELEPSHVTDMPLAHCILGKFLGVYIYSFIHQYSSLEAGLAGTRAQSCDRYGSGTLHPGQVLGGIYIYIYIYIYMRSHFYSTHLATFFLSFFLFFSFSSFLADRYTQI